MCSVHLTAPYNKIRVSPPQKAELCTLDCTTIHKNGCLQLFLYQQTSLWPFGVISPELTDIYLAVGWKSIGERVSKHMKELSKIPPTQHNCCLCFSVHEHIFPKKTKTLETVYSARSHAVCWCIQFGPFPWRVHFLQGKRRRPQITMIWSKCGAGGMHSVLPAKRRSTSPGQGLGAVGKVRDSFLDETKAWILGLKGCIPVRQWEEEGVVSWGRKGILWRKRQEERQRGSILSK